MTMKNGDMPAMPIDVKSLYEANASWGKAALGLNKCEMFCLHMGVAETGDAELDDIIRKGNRQKMAAHMMAHLMTIERIASYEDQASCAIKAADSLLAELERMK